MAAKDDGGAGTGPGLELAALADAPLAEQVGGLERALRQCPVVAAILGRAPNLGLPNYYLGAGGVAQTVWNQLYGFDTEYGIKDYDLVYFDPSETTAATEGRTAQRVIARFADLKVKMDVTNQARVHQWYPRKFGRSIPPYRSTEHAIATWPTTASSIGVRLEADRLVVCAPFGLHDLFARIVRPNKALISRAVYEAKVERWTPLWPDLAIVPW
jgi:hypothetical protein